MNPIHQAIANLVYRCLQWEDGEIKGYDWIMFESLLPIILSPHNDAGAFADMLQIVKTSFEAQRNVQETAKELLSKFIVNKK